MKVSAYVSLVAFGSAALAGVTVRQADVITGILSDVGTKISSVESAAAAYNGNADPVVDASKTLVSTINDGVTKAKGSEELTLEGALGLQQPVKDLTDKASSLVDTLTGKREEIAKNGQCSITRTQVGDIDSASNELINAIVAKVPTEAQSIAETLVADLKAVLAKAKTNFNEANCVDSAQASSAPASSAASSSAPAASSAPASSGAAPATSKPAGSSAAAPTHGASSAAPTGTAVVPPHHTPSSPVVVPTAAAGALVAPGLLAMGVAAALL